MQFEKGLGKFLTSFFAQGRKGTEQKWQIGTSLPCLHTLRSRRSLFIIEELFAADNRPLLEIAIYMATLQTENHVTGAFKKADIPLPTHTTFAVLQGNKLLLHLTPEAGTELIGFAHSVYR